MGQTKTIGDPTDKKVLEYFKNDETIPMSDKGPEIYAALAKNYAMHSLLSGELKAGIFEEESKIDAKMAKAEQNPAQQYRLAHTQPTVCNQTAQNGNGIDQPPVCAKQIVTIRIGKQVIFDEVKQ